ncbi:MAG: carboxynorspermidine decarboxylase [Agarilytica sp.]
MIPAAYTFKNFDPKSVPSPCFVVDEVAIENNLQVLADIQRQSGAKVLLALKAFSFYHLAPLISRYLSGTCASGLHEAKLGKEYFEGEVHTFCAAFKEQDLIETLATSDHVVFNSFNQWQRFKQHTRSAKQKRPQLSYGLRVNPKHSEGTMAIYDPCAPCSRLGIPIDQLAKFDITGIDGVHFHTLCEQKYEPLSRTLDVIEKKLASILPHLKWVNFGGGHHITDPQYNRAALIKRVKEFNQKYAVQVYLEPGEAVAINSGVLVSEVLDLTHNEKNLAILDTSATCHMPDTLEMPYRAEVFGAGQAKEKTFDYRLGGQTCLAGDVMGDYSFDQPLQLGQRLMFDDMAHYTMVKTTTFNGINLPSIAVWNSVTNKVRLVKNFGYKNFKSRL